jgi:REP element-mobilizing transposase RayT
MLREWKEEGVLELNFRRDHGHKMVSVHPRVSISELMGTIKGKCVYSELGERNSMQPLSGL